MAATNPTCWISSEPNLLDLVRTQPGWVSLAGSPLLGSDETQPGFRRTLLGLV
ncbi:hypothetical protein SLEP1_g2591 [Rubroshorea leprosula]|uniref:Uncharacterized protein n=1 Tax=Rubroshorea leprosula TaxID=152421 RepID=A0AAV5HI29_9ROSI|nr:hypothetical protein SLEP1_g2591 [Rubroshorea leprosula]